MTNTFNTERCNIHGDKLREGDICPTCEAAADAWMAQLDSVIACTPHQLWFVCSKQALFKCPVLTFNEAKLLAHTLMTSGCVSGIRIARYDEQEGCEQVLHKF